MSADSFFKRAGFLNSLRGRMVLAFCGIGLVTALTITFFVQREVEQTMVRTEDEHARNLLQTVMLNIETEYQSYRFYLNSLMNERKSEVKNISELALRQIEGFYYKSAAGLIPEEEAEKRAKDVVRRMRYDDDVGYVWIQDTQTPIPNLLVHPPAPHLEDQPGTDPLFYSALGNGKNLLKEFADLCLEQGGGFVEYRWPKPLPDGLSKELPKISHVRYFEPWGWVIGSGVYLDDIHRDVQKRLNAIADELRQTLSQVKLAKTGYMFIFNGEKELIVHPGFSGHGMAERRNPNTGELLQDELMRAAKNPDQAWRYTWNRPLSDRPDDFKYMKRAYVDYFEPLDWYIASTIYEDEILNPAMVLRKKVLAIMVLFILAAIGLSAWLSQSLTRPLRRLTKAARKIETAGVDAEDIPASGTVETRELGLCLHSMLESIRKSTREKEELFEARRQSEENLQITLNSIGDGVIATDTDGHITRMNPVAQRLTGWSFDEACEKPLLDVFRIVYADTREAVGCPVEKVIAQDEILALDKDVVLLSRDGHEYLISDSGAPIRSDAGKTLGVVLVFRDVTEERSLQTQLNQSQKMDAVGRLAGGVAHDFNNMIGGIIGASEILDGMLPDNPEMKELNGLIIETAERAADLTKKLLAVGRKQPSATSALDLHSVLKDVGTLLKSSVDRRISIDMNLTAGKSTIIGDHSQLQNVFLNLGINASHAMPEGGTIHISSQNIELDELYCNSSVFNVQPGHYIEIEVHDSGCGIPPEHLKRIFEPFFTTKEPGKGTGLGLSAVYGTVEQHHGAIMVYSEVDVGTTFHLFFPLTDREFKPGTKPVTIPSENGETVLIVDDEKVMRITAKSILESLGYKVLVAEDGKEGMELFEEHIESVDLVILDMIMPERDGRDCFVAMKKLKPSVKVILSSGFSHEEDLAELKKKGLDAFIRKPCRSAVLSRTVHGVLNG